jgi:hypothetical protein
MNRDTFLSPQLGFLAMKAEARLAQTDAATAMAGVDASKYAAVWHTTSWRCGTTARCAACWKRSPVIDVTHRPQLRPCSVNPVTHGLDGIGKN